MDTKTIFVLTAYMTDESIEKNDRLLKEYTENVINYFDTLPKVIALSNGLPLFLLKNFAIPYLPLMKTFFEYQTNMKNITQQWMNKKIESMKNNESKNNNKDYMSQLLAYKESTSKSLKNGDFSYQDMISDFNLAFIAGAHTTVISIEQAVLYLAKYPNFQLKVYNELIKHNLNKISNYGNTTLLAKCALFRAFIYEVLRFNGLTTFSIPRGGIKNDIKVEYNNSNNNNTKEYYIVPKGSQVIFDVWGHSHDTEIFYNNNINDKNNYKFDINNWLITDNNDCNSNSNSDNEYKFDNSKYLPIFGQGRRNCAGQALAKTELYLIVSVLILNYQFMAVNKDFQVPVDFIKPNTPMIGVICKKRESAS